MKRVLILQNAPLFHAGSFEDELKRRNISYNYHKTFEDGSPSEDIVNSYSGIIVLGGPLSFRVTNPQSSQSLSKLISFLREALKQHKACLAVSQGACLLAAAQGSWVEPAPQKEIGWIEAEVYNDYSRNSVIYSKVSEKRFPVFAWHDAFHGFPPQGYWYLNSEHCRYLATGIHGNCYLFNFHPEITESLIQQWSQHYFQDVESKERAELILQQWKAHADFTLSFSRKIMHAFESFLR